MRIPSGRVMLSANLIGDANAHHRIRHRARHGLRGGVASPLQRFAPVDPRRRPRLPRQRPRQQSCHGLCFIPWRSRAFDAAHAPRQRLTQACAPGQPLRGFRGVEHPASQAGKLDWSSSSNTQLLPRESAAQAALKNALHMMDQNADQMPQNQPELGD